MARQIKNWKEASSLILAAKKLNPLKQNHVPTKQNNLPCADFNILTMKRSSSSQFFPNAVVFPGGAAEQSDFSSSWLSIFEKRGIYLDQLRSLKTNHSPAMYKTHDYSNPNKEIIDSELGFRINAIRETFEESGILIASKEAGETEIVNHISKDEVDEWRKKIYKDPSNFMQFCAEKEIYPNVFILKEWCNWLTPVLEQTLKRFNLKKRYDTMFYIACVDQELECSDDGNEAQNVLWSSPDDLLRNYYSNKIQLSPPQVHELSRIMRFPEFNSLKKYLCERSKEGIERWMHVIYQTSDGMIFVNAGDDLYPADPNIYSGGTDPIESTTSESRQAAKYLCRMEISTDCPRIHCYSNTSYKFGQVSSMHIDL